MSLPVLIVAVALFAAAFVGIALFALSFTSAFPVSSVVAVGTDHLSAQDIRNLADIPEGSSIIGLDVDAVRSRVSQNPWVADVTVDRGFDGTVTISVRERVPFAIVEMESREIAWFLADDGIWLEPANVKPVAGRTLFQTALAEAHARGLQLVAGVPATVNPAAGAPCTDEPVLGALEYQRTFDEELSSQVAYYVASTESAISCVLSSGLEISLGAPDDIAAKQTVILELLQQHPNQLTYINVRVPSKPTYRAIDRDDMAPGTGVYTFTDPTRATEGEGGSGDGTSADAGTGDGATDGGSTYGDGGGWSPDAGDSAEPSSGL